MTNKILNQLFSSCKKWKTLVLISMLLTLGVGQMWATYYYRGEKNSWGATAMTDVNGIYSYYSATSGAHQFKISTSTSSYDYNYTYVTKNYKQTDVSNIGDYSSNNCYCWQSSEHYILVFNPNTSVNSTNMPIICAATALPSAGFESDGNTISYYNNVDGDVQSNALDRTDGSAIDLTSKAITDLYLKAFNTKMYQHYEVNLLDKTAYHFYYKIHRTAESAGSTGFTEVTSADGYSAGSVNWGSFDGSKYRKPTYYVTANQSLLTGLGSGLYTMSYYFTHVGTTETYRLPSTSSKYNELKWKIPVPAVTSGAVTSNGSGSGTNESPFTVADGSTITFTASGSQTSTDANSVLYVKWESDAYGPASTTTKTITPTTTKQSMTVKLKYYNSADELSGAETTLTIYYQSTLTPSIGISSISPSPANSGDEVTITASRQNAGTANITYQYSTNGSTWTTIGSATSSTSKTWTVPASTSTTTYYFRAKMTYNSTTYTSETFTLKTYGKKTIKVKDSNAWGDNFKIHRWGGDDPGTGWPGETVNITSAGGQWKQIVLYSSSSDFLLCNGQSGSTADNAKTTNQTFDGVNDGYCYIIGTPASGSTSFSEGDCPDVPEVSTAAATNIAATSVTFNASDVDANNDAITEYGFKWGTTSACSSGTEAASNLGAGTTFSATKSDLSSGTTYYYKAYATNGFGTTYGSVQSFRTKYVTTVTLNPQGGTGGTESVTATEGSAMPSGKAAPGRTGYTFEGYYANADGSGTQYYNASMASAHNWDVAASTAEIHAKWTPNTYTVHFHRNGASEATVYQDFTYDQAQNLTANTYTRTGYTFGGWAISKANADAGIVAYTDGQNVSNLTSENGATFHLFAKWTAKTYTVNLDLDEDHKGSTTGATTSQTVTYNAVTTTVPSRPTGADGYGLDGYYTGQNGEGTKLINGDGTWIASVEGYTDADAKWIRDGGVTLYAYYKVGTITALTLSSYTVAPGTEITVTPTIAPLPSGTSYVCYEIQYSNGTPLPSQPEMSRSGNVVTFAAPTSSATYIVHATLRTGGSCGGGTLLSTLSTTFQVAGSHTVTVQYMCGDMVIKAATEMTGKPLEWSDDITAPTITGYTFARWEAGDGVTIKDGDDDGKTSTTATIKIKAIYDGTLTAVYNKKRMIYFYNTLNWGSVYVYFYKNDSYWQTVSPYKGSGANTTYTWKNTPYSEGKHGQMQPVSEGSKIYYFDVEAAGVNASYDDVVFTEHLQHGYDYFYQTNAVRRGDYKSSMPMFVPLADQTADVHNQTNYYNHGYWMNYPENTGYTLKIYNAWNVEKETGAVREFPFPYSADKKMPLKLDVEFNDAGTHEYWFMVYRNDGTYLGSTYHFKQGYQDEQIITGGNNKNKITTSAPGNYTLTLTYHDNGSGTVNYYIGLNFPIANNDYRIVYNDRVKWSSNTAHTASWYHPSDIIRQIENGATEPKKDTVSFYISKAAGANASMKFQKASVTGEGVITWTDVASGTIDIPTSVSTSGVYNFIVSQPVGGGSIALEKVEPYTGSYYIRTDCAGSTKWDSYKATDHQMTFSDYTKANEGYTHYYAHWAERGTNVKFVIANDYSPFVSDTLTKDVDIYFKNMDDGGTLKSDGSSAAFQDKYSANIRFMYNEQTNKLSRAYLASSTDISKKFLVMRGNSAAATGHIFTEDGKELTDAAGGRVAELDEYEMNFADDQNFIYETTIKANPTALVKLYATYCGRRQEFKGDTTATFAVEGNHAVEILGGTYAAETKEKMRIVYDFKTNRLVCAWLPSGDITGDLDINADVMIIREHQGDAQQIKFTTNESKLDEVKTVYGVMRFNRWTLNNKDKSTHDPVGDPKSQYERALYWISFPFDVNLSDVFGFGSYGEDWIIEYYDGAARAAEGYWIDSPGFWRYVWPAQRASFKLEAGKGYVLALDLDRMKYDNTNFWTNNIEQIELFFPSASTAGYIQNTTVKTTADSHECTIDRRTDKTKPDVDKDRTRADSHWNMIGVPSYANYGTSLTSDGSTVVTWNRTPYTQDLPFLYEWNMVDDSYTVQSGTTYPFKSMYAYMVQYHGDLYWSLASATPSSIIARRASAQAPQEVEFKLELQQNEQMVDQTFVKLSDKEEVSANFNFDEDLCKEFNRGKANIYTIVETYIPVAGNILPLSEQTTLVPVGVKTSADGDYTFSMPNGTDGVGVTLIDGVTGERTNLALTDYTVSLEKGTYDQRFVLEISPIEHTTTAIENSEKTDAPNTVCKKLIDGVLYIIKDGKVFDARGARLQ